MSSALSLQLSSRASVLRRPDKASLAHAVTDHANQTQTSTVFDEIPNTDMYVLDGGSLLHRLPWNRGDSYKKIVRTYADLVRKYGNTATIVIDGYQNGATIKDNVHSHRGHVSSRPTVSLTPDAEFRGRKSEFLSVTSNKQTLINLMADELQAEGCHVVHAKGDADVDIVKAAVLAAESKPTTLIGEDTDLLVLLLYYCPSDVRCPLYFRSDKQAKTKRVQTRNIVALKHVLGGQLCEQIMFLHAFTGCDSTSRIYSIGEKSALGKLLKCETTLQAASTGFLLENQTRTMIAQLGS